MSELPEIETVILPTATSPGRHVAGATLRVISAMAREIRLRDAESRAANKALAVVRRYPLYTLLGGHRHLLLNEDIFEKKESEAAE